MLGLRKGPSVNDVDGLGECLKVCMSLVVVRGSCNGPRLGFKEGRCSPEV